MEGGRRRPPHAGDGRTEKSCVQGLELVALERQLAGPERGHTRLGADQARPAQAPIEPRRLLAFVRSRWSRSNPLVVYGQPSWALSAAATRAQLHPRAGVGAEGGSDRRVDHAVEIRGGSPESRPRHVPVVVLRRSTPSPTGLRTRAPDTTWRTLFRTTAASYPCSSSAHSTRPPGLAVRTNVLRKGTDAGSGL